MHLLAQGLRRLFLLGASLVSLVRGGSTAVSPLLSQSLAAAVLHTTSKDYSRLVVLRSAVFGDTHSMRGKRNSKRNSKLKASGVTCYSATVLEQCKHQTPGDRNRME